MPDEVYRKARIKAAERDSSVSALVRAFLTELSADENDFAQRQRLQEEVLASIDRFRAGDRLTRVAVHDRDEVR